MKREPGGFSLIEILIALAITLTVMATVYPIVRSSSMLGRVETHRAERAAEALRAIDDVTFEIARAGFGLGRDVERLVAGVPGETPAADRITIRSNPEGVFAWTASALGWAPPHFALGDLVLLTGLRQQRARAVVALGKNDRLVLNSLDRPTVRTSATLDASRELYAAKIREVQFFLSRRPGEEAPVLMKQVNGAPDRVLARGVAELRFDYRDSAGESIAPVRVPWAADLAVVRVHLRLNPQLGPADPAPFLPGLTASVGLESHAASVPMDAARRGLRFLGQMSPIANAVGITSSPFDDVGTLLAAGQPRDSGTGYLLRFIMQRDRSMPNALDNRVETVVGLPDVRDAVAAVLPFENGAPADPLYVVSSSMGRVQVWKIRLESPKSLSLHATLPAADAVAGAAFGIDGFLYLTDPMKRVLWRYQPPTAGSGEEVQLEQVRRFDGIPGPIACADSGSLYVLVDTTGNDDQRTQIWRIDLQKEPALPSSIMVASIPGEPYSLAFDPISGSLFALCRDRGDSVLRQLSTAWLQRPTSLPPEAFRLSRFQKEASVAIPTPDTPVLPATLIPSGIAFAAFDADGFLYLGADRGGQSDRKGATVDTVLKFQVDRPDGVARHRIGVGSVVEQEPGVERKRLRLNAWKRPTSVR